MKLLVAFLLLVAPSFAQGPLLVRLGGTWKLVSVEDTTKDGRTGPSQQFGAHPKGFLMYASDGHMCATIANGDRPAWKDPSKPTDAEKIEYYDTLIAYCGTFKYDPEHGILTHYPEVAWTPGYVGSTQVRPFKMEGDRLIITVTAGMEDIGVKKRVLVWKKAKQVDSD